MLYINIIYNHIRYENSLYFKSYNVEDIEIEID